MTKHNRTIEAQEVFKEKRKPQVTPKLLVQLNEEQKEVKECVFNNDVTFILGDYGCGKTLCATAIALDLFHKREVDKIIIARPFDFKATGFLTGDLNEKLQYHMLPIKHNFYQCYDHKKIDEYYKEMAIQVLPIPYLRGVTFTNAVVVVDEIQEMTYEDFELILTRLGKGSKLIFTGSREQNVLGKKSCIEQVMKLKDCDLVCIKELIQNHRNGIVPKILEYIKNDNK